MVAFVGYEDANIDSKIREVKKYPQIENDWLNNGEEDIIYSHISNMINYSIKIKKECEIYQLKYFNTSQNFMNTLKEVLEYFKEAIKSEK